MGNINKNPLVGFGVVGTKTLTKLSFVFLLISPLLSLVANPTAQIPLLGYWTKTTLFFLPYLFANVSVIWVMAEYIVLRIGIFFNKSFINFKILLPMNDNEIKPIRVINIIDNAISKPGIENGK